MPERRPRIPEDLAELIDARRGARSFEAFVRDTLDAALRPRYIVESDPDKPRRFRVVDGDPEVGEPVVYADGLTRIDADIYAELLAHIANAVNDTETALEDMEAIEEALAADDLRTVYAELRVIANRLYDIAGHRLGQEPNLSRPGR